MRVRYYAAFLRRSAAGAQFLLKNHQTGAMRMASSERRAGTRTSKQRSYHVEVRVVGFPVYQFKIQDVSANGLGLVVRPDSNFLKQIEVGQEVQVNLASQTESLSPGHYRAVIEHISALEQGPFKSHLLVGTRLVERL
jgi:hypothetical protein